jgi:hypothetical protein
MSTSTRPTYEEGFRNGRKSREKAVETLRARIAELEEAEDESISVIDRLSHLLAEIAIVLKGPELERHLHGYADLPQLVTAVIAENAALLDLLLQAREALQGTQERLGYWNFTGSEHQIETHNEKIDARAKAAIEAIDAAINKESGQAAEE